MIARIFAAIALALFANSASAQYCNDIVNPMTGQFLKRECFAPNGQMILNGPILLGGQQFLVRNGQLSGCASSWSLSLGRSGREGGIALNLGGCIEQAQQSGAIRTVYAEQGVRQGQAGAGNVTCNNCNVTVNGDGGAGNVSVPTRREAYCDRGDKKIYNGVLSCVEESGAGYLWVDSVKYRNVKISVGLNEPTKDASGNTCYLKTPGGQLVYDFFASGANNPLGTVVSSDDGGTECVAAKRRFGMK